MRWGGGVVRHWDYSAMPLGARGRNCAVDNSGLTDREHLSLVVSGRQNQ